MRWFKMYVGLVISVVFVVAVACSSGFHRYNPPKTHTVSHDGALHNTGAKDATKNCVSCHGAELKGGDGPSCFECHKKKWN